MKVSAAQAILKVLEEHGANVVFGYPGSAIAPLYDALSHSRSIRHILPRSEQSAAHAASGYAKASGKVGVCIATSGPGATNLITGIATAYSDSIPMVAITGQVHSALVGRDAFQEADITGATNPFTKHNYLVRDADEITDVLREAFYIASTGRPGPVLIDIPVDIFSKTVEFKKFKQPSLRGYKPTYKGNALQMKRVAACLAQARRPVICVGGGCVNDNAADALGEFVKQTQIPVVTTLKALGAIPTDHPLNLGMVGMYGGAAARQAVYGCDTLMIIGARIGDRSINNAKIADRTGIHIIHIDIDPAEIGKNINANIPVVGSARDVLNDLNAHAIKTNVDKDWVLSLAALRKEERVKPCASGKPGFVTPTQVISALNQLTGGDCIVTTEVGQNQIWAAQTALVLSPRNFITSGGLGTMGYGLPAAIGAKIARPEKTVVAISGDGSLQMSLAELATIFENGMDIKILLLDNQALGMIREYQRTAYGENYFSVFLKGNPDFVKLADAFGILGERVTDNADILPALTRALSYKGAYFVDFMVDPLEPTSRLE